MHSRHQPRRAESIIWACWVAAKGAQEPTGSLGVGEGLEVFWPALEAGISPFSLMAAAAAAAGGEGDE